MTNPGLDESTLTTSMQRGARAERAALGDWQCFTVCLALVVLGGGVATCVSLQGIDRKIASLRSDLHHLGVDRQHAAEAIDRLWYRLDLMEQP